MVPIFHVRKGGWWGLVKKGNSGRGGGWEGRGGRPSIRRKVCSAKIEPFGSLISGKNSHDQRV